MATKKNPVATSSQVALDHTVNFLAVRYGLTKDNKLLVGIIELTEDSGRDFTDDEMPLLFLDRKTFKLTPGNVYEIRTNADRTTFGVKTRWVSQYKDRAVAAALQAKAKAFDMARDAEVAAKREGAPTAVLESTLGPLRKVYWDMTEFQRVSFEVWLLRYLRRGV